eukprot:TRINITY_DN104611_c0_g1_i1.p2 TRINITY_DN104611_c0_g1~~TRINITY_DN104611_c0_g1_i1.p2  ORF type:complete len:100 (-),score=0.93 TRINITY_DN104611_c0_g1_i1:366-665(-)
MFGAVYSFRSEAIILLFLIFEVVQDLFKQSYVSGFVRAPDEFYKFYNNLDKLSQLFISLYRSEFIMPDYYAKCLMKCQESYDNMYIGNNLLPFIAYYCY